MCSVVGVFSKHGADVSREAFILLSSLSHRGPQAFGVKSPFFEKKSGSLDGLLPLPKSSVVLGHCLLSTTGYGVQPLSCGDVFIAHNGQIYNYKEIDPCPGEVVSDSEVVAKFIFHSLKSKGIEESFKDFFLKAEGEYAVGVLYGGKLYAFRDFLGIKPLWFGENDSVFAFASEPSALMKIDIQFPRPLLPGHFIEISEKGIVDKEVFTLNDFRSLVPKNYSFEALKRGFCRAMDLQCAGLKKAAVLFSGGVDSSLVAMEVSKRVPETTLFVAGLENSFDVKNAERSAKILGLDLEKVILSESDVVDLAFRSMKILSFFDEMQLGLAVPELACAKAISKSGFKVVFSGQGSDEIFCGYNNYANVLRQGGFGAVENELWFSVSRMWSRNFYRDDAILASQSLELRVPFMFPAFFREAMAFPVREKILSFDDKVRKHPVRRLALSLGLPKEISDKPKKAMQYGSGVQKIVSRFGVKSN